MIVDISKKILIVGLGLLGGSYAKALTRNGFDVKVITLNQDDIDLVLSHLNSIKRKHFDDIPAITRFNSIFGKSILNKMNITLIEPDEIILDKQLLKGKI